MVFEKNYSKFFVLAVITILAGFALVGANNNDLENDGFLQDYFGYYTYFPQLNLSYFFYINNTERMINFSGVNETNLDHRFSMPIDPRNHFVKRINYVWFDGWFDELNLHLNQYIPAETIYSALANEDSGIYSANFSVNEIVYSNLTNVSFEVIIDVNSSTSTIRSSDSNLNSVSNIHNIFDKRVSPHVFSEIILETVLVPNENSTNYNIEVHLWVKEDLIRNGMNPQWTYPIYPANAFSVGLISPIDSSSIETSDIKSTLEFQFKLNESSYDWFQENYPKCDLYIEGTDDIVIPTDLNVATGIGVGTLELNNGHYSWRVNCENSQHILWSSTVNSFDLNQKIDSHPPKKVIQEEEGGRRRPRNSTIVLDNLSNNLDNKEDASDENNSLISLITGAVIGTFGKKGALGLGIFIMLIGVIALVVYNRRYLGIVKED